MASSPSLSNSGEILIGVLRHASEAQRAAIERSWPGQASLLASISAVRAVHPEADVAGIISALMEQTQWARFQRWFYSHMMVEDAARGRILDIGCGSSFQENVADVARLATQIDGVDPGEGVNQHPSLTLRWRGPFESAPISAAVYDMAFAYNVVEHIERARPFFEKVREILKPGGVFWALTPNSRHLFCKLSRAMEIVGVKWFMARRSPGINNYSAYYRLNSPSRIDRAIDGLGFASAQYFFTDAPGWEKGYLPPGTRWIGRAFDSTLASRINDRKLILAYRLTAPG